MESFKKLLTGRWTLAVFSFLLGLGTYWSVETYQSRQQQSRISSLMPVEISESPSLFDSFFSQDEVSPPEDFFSTSTDPFAESFRRMESLQKGFFEDFGGPTAMTAAADLKVHEDDEFVHYEISVPGLQEKNVKVFLNDGSLTVSGEAKKKTEQGFLGAKGEAVFSSVFSRTFPVPDNTDPNKAKIQYETDKVIVKFPKVHSGTMQIPVHEETSLSV